MDNHDLFVVIDENEECSKQDVIDVVKTGTNPNFKWENVLSVKEINDKVKLSLNLNEDQITTLDSFKMSGNQTPFVYFWNMGYQNIVMLEDDMMIVGPIEELTKNDIEYSQSSWSTKTYPKWDKNLKFRGSQENFVYEGLGYPQDKWDKLKTEYKGMISRAPYVWGQRHRKKLEEVFLRFLSDDKIRNMWITKQSKSSRNGMTYAMFHHNVIINQLTTYEVFMENPDKILGVWGKIQKIMGHNDLDGDTFKWVKNGLSSYVLHITVGKRKKEGFEKIYNILQDLKYDGENSPDEMYFYTTRKTKIDNNWFLNNNPHITDKELKMFIDGTWLNDDSVRLEKMRTKKGRKELGIK
jgi:hypothetical protein